MSTFQGRFAPSPTGRMHLGNLWAALLGWLWARKEGGRFFLRIEDLDQPRCRPEHTQALLEDLRWLGLDVDGEPVFQSARADAYAVALDALSARGLLYPCFCTRAEIARAASAPHGPTDEGPKYPGTCRALGADERAAKSKQRPPALRFVPPPGEVVVEDLVAGRFAQDVADAVGDFVVRRNDGVVSYQLAVVVDDAQMGITHVLRGDDLLSSTPRQLRLFEALRLRPPAYAHVPLLLGEDGKRLAKREGAFTLEGLRKAGVSPAQVVGLLAGFAGLTDGGPVAAADLVDAFELGKLPRAPVVTSEADVRTRLGL